MKANEALRVLDARCNRRNAERRGVGRQNAVFAHHVIKRGKHRSLGIEVFVNGLYDKADLCGFAQHVGGAQLLVVCGTLRVVDFALFDELVPDAAHAGNPVLEGRVLGVVQKDFPAGLDEDLGNAAAHGARADHHGFLVE